MRITPVLFLLATLTMGCTRMTTKDCKSPDECSLQNDLCHNSCSHPGALSNCGACCEGALKSCNDCEPYDFANCD